MDSLAHGLNNRMQDQYNRRIRHFNLAPLSQHVEHMAAVLEGFMVDAFGHEFEDNDSATDFYTEVGLPIRDLYQKNLGIFGLAGKDANNQPLRDYIRHSKECLIIIL